MTDFSKYHLGSDAAIITGELPGMKSRMLLRQQELMEGKIVSYPRRMPIAMKRALGAIIEDVDGNRFIDFFSGCGVLNVGHSNPDVLAYVREQQDHLIHALDFPTENKMKLIPKLLDELPAQARNEYKVAFVSPSGSDGVEAAIKLAKHYTGRSTILAFQGAYHGMAAGSLSVTSDAGHKEGLHGLMPGVQFVPYSYCYRCMFKSNAANCKFDCFEYLKNLLENSHSGVPKPAAILLEPVQGEGGNVVPKDGYLELVIDLAKRHGVVTIFDEVQTGFFRTGDFTVSNSLSLLPDIIIMSKGLGGIGFPVSAILYSKKIESWGPGFHIGTFRANQVSIAAANGALDFVNKNDLKRHVSRISAYLMEKLRGLAGKSKFIGEVRGKGLLIGIEFVKDKNTKEPYPEIVSHFRNACFESGLLFEVGGHYQNVVRIVPPLIINETLVDNALRIMETNLLAVERQAEVVPEEQATAVSLS